MRQKVTLMVILLFALTLTACGATSQGTSEQPSQNGGPPQGDNVRETPLVLKLALGTFKLDETDYPITAGQAKEFLPLWKVARSLSQSDTAATQEIQAVIEQIQETMTPEQMQTINDMGLTFQDKRAISEKLGLDFGSGRLGNMNPEMQATVQAARERGQGPPGGFGAFIGGDPGGPGGGFSPQAQQTAMAGRGGSNSGGLGLPTTLLDAIIKFLEAKAQ